MSQHADGSIMKRALYIGIFDPITLGHLDILERSSDLVDELIIGVVAQPPNPTDIGLSDRIRLVKKSVSHLKNVQVVEFCGLLGQFIVEYEVNLFIRGLRMMTDFESELNIVHTNYHLHYNIDTVFLSTNEVYSSYSSREVRQIAKNHGLIEPFLPPSIVNDVKSIYA